MRDENSLNSNIRYLKGVGEAREKLFNKLGIVTFRDLIEFFPRAYEDRTAVKTISSLTVGESVCVHALVADTPKLSHIRKGLNLVKFRAVDETGALEITFFNAPFVKDSIKHGETYVFYGKVSGTLLRPEMTNPVFDSVNTEKSFNNSNYRQTGCIMPVYPLTAKLTQKAVATAVRNALSKCIDELPSVLPADISRQHKLAQVRYAYENIHFPASFKDLDIARRRLIFEELFVLVTAMRLMREKSSKKHGKTIKKANFEKFYKNLPYTPTGAQKRAIDEIMQDLTSGKMMNRLIQGDVGSGKTLVAAAAAWAVWSSGAQCAFMAPTEILAKQHFVSLTALLEPLDMKVALLIGSMTAKNKRITYEKLQNGEIDLIIGTHALISEGVEFSNLALVITDEQHRFGVTQRAMLAEKGDNPHVLVMSATPIPRTLALIIYGDLSVSIIDEMPPGRTEVETFVVGEKYRQRAYEFIRKLVGEGRQIFIVCPAIENETEDADKEIKTAVDYYETLKTKIFKDLRVAIVHGKMPVKQKDVMMADFASGNADILVATTVVEVGVDVPNAALMIVENADRFGLSQLHQLRGRVGRGKHKSYCILFKTQDGKDSERLQVMKSTTDGFKVAEEDLKIRGPGDFFGERQHGLPQLHIANLATDMMTLTEAQRAADEVLKQDPTLELTEHQALAEQIERMFSCVF